MIIEPRKKITSNHKVIKGEKPRYVESIIKDGLMDSYPIDDVLNRGGTKWKRYLCQ